MKESKELSHLPFLPSNVLSNIWNRKLQFLGDILLEQATYQFKQLNNHVWSNLQAQLRLL